MQSFQDYFESLSSDVNIKGKTFERAIKWWLESDPVWSSQLKHVWLWDKFPHKTGRDTGIDIVAESITGDYWAIQCKAYSPDSQLKKADIDSFLSASNRKFYSHRLLVTTTKSVGPNARETLAAQEKPVQIVDWIRLNDSAVDWSLVSQEKIQPSFIPRKLRPHQQEALDQVVLGFKKSDRGQLIMACGSGKTLTALRINEVIAKDLTVVLVPSLTLLSQTLNDWLKDRVKQFNWLAVCSDDSVTNDPQDNSRLIDFDFPATTNQSEIARFLEGPKSKVVFSTYHSSPILLAAIKKSKQRVNLLICDEAHRLAGKTGRDFGSFLDPEAPVTKRLFMTATPRVFSPQIKKMLESSDMQVLSMDDREVFGSVFFNYSFAQAIKDKILTDYRVVIVGIASAEVSELVDKRALVKAGAIETDSESLALHVALAKAMRKWNLRRVISFHSRVSKARKFGSDQVLVNQWMPQDEVLSGDFTSTTISSAMPTDKRRSILDVLKNIDETKSCLVTNARCLTEGIDVPTLDAVVFVDPKSSQVDIIQAVGRAIRLGGIGKTHGTIVVPIFIPQGKKEIANFDTTNYKKIGDVLNALRAHDQEFGEEIDKLRTELGQRGAIERMPSRLIWDIPSSVDTEFVNTIQALTIEMASSSWDEMFGRMIKFVETFGHSRPAAIEIFEGSNVGDWVVKQRTFFRRGSLPLERAQKLENLSSDWVWDPAEEMWQTRFHELVEHIKRTGTSRVSSKNVSTAQLGKWVAMQRAKYRAEELSPEKIELLDSAASDWSWNPKDQDWQDMYELLKVFEAREGHTSVPAIHIEEGESLGNWVFHQRANFLNPDTKSRLSLDRVEKLQSLSTWTWNPVDDVFESKFKYLLEYIKMNGSSRVPIDYVIDGFALGKWISHRRDAYKKGRLDQSVIEQFEASSADWSWTPFNDTWEAAFTLLCDYVAVYGNSRIPNSFVFNEFKLGTWVANQKTKYKQGRLSADQISRLESVDSGWTWDLMETLWQDFFAELKEFVKVNGHANVPYKVNGEKSKLGEWVTGQRKFFARGKMDPSRKELLDSIGFRWDALDPWEVGFANAKQFADREGHTSVSSRHMENGKLLTKWMAHQRSKYRNGQLTKEQIRRLESLAGWEWNPTSKPKD
jgi:superfamily II DNA or RNA helicase